MSRRAGAGVAVAVALAACTSSPPASGTEVLGLDVDVPDEFGEPTVLDAPPGVEKRFWVGPRRPDATSVGITAARTCDPTGEEWEALAAAARAGQHTGWDDYRPTIPPVPVEVDGAREALRARGTYSLPVDGREDRMTLVHDELLVRSDGVVHRFRVEGSSANVDELPLDDLLARVRVASTDCPA